MNKKITGKSKKLQYKLLKNEYGYRPMIITSHGEKLYYGSITSGTYNPVELKKWVEELKVRVNNDLELYLSELRKDGWVVEE